MKKLAAVMLMAMVVSGCVTKKAYVRGVLTAYKKGLKVGRVIGRDQILYELKSPSCFAQKPDELMNPDPGFDALAEQSAKETDKHFETQIKKLLDKPKGILP